MTSAGTDTFLKSARKSVVVTALLHAIATGTEQCIICAASACIIAGEVSGTKNGAVLSATHFGKSLRQDDNPRCHARLPSQNRRVNAFPMKRGAVAWRAGA